MIVMKYFVFYYIFRESIVHNFFKDCSGFFFLVGLSELLLIAGRILGPYRRGCLFFSSTRGSKRKKEGSIWVAAAAAAA